MKNILLIPFFCMMSCLFVHAGTYALTGSWTSNDGAVQYEIIDGFRPNRGAVLVFEDGKDPVLGTWSLDDEIFTVRVGWTSGSVEFIDENTFLYRRTAYRRAESIEETNIVSIKHDEGGFVEQVLSSSWLDISSNETVVFRNTFAVDSGVKETFAPSGGFTSFESWGVGSGVWKIGSTVFIDARVSDQYLVGVQANDRYVVYKAQGKASDVERTQLKEEREQFLAALTTDSWYTTSSFRSDTIYRFRPIESELKGKKISTRDNHLVSSRDWEYSLDKGSIKIGFTEYIGALLIGSTLAFVDSSGNQQFYRRVPHGENRRFTLSDVASLPLSETHADRIKSMLSGQFQKGDYVYTFEFSDDSLSGYVHKFVSQPFTITGNRFISSLLSSRGDEQLWAVEDVVIFDRSDAFKRDSRRVRLAPLTDEASEALHLQNLEAADAALEKQVIVRVRTKDGRTIDVNLPVSGFEEIADIFILVE